MFRFGRFSRPSGRADVPRPCQLSNARKIAMLVTVSFATAVANLTTAAHLTAFPEVAEYYNVSIAAAANSIGIMLLGLGTGSLLWSPISQCLGRRTAFLSAWTLFVPFSFWLAFSKSFSSFLAARFFAGFAGSVSQTVSASMIMECFTSKHRGAAMAFWSIFIIAGSQCAPLIGSAILTVRSFHWIYYMVIILVGASWLAIYFFCPETIHFQAKDCEPMDPAMQSGRAESTEQGSDVGKQDFSMLAKSNTPVLHDASVARADKSILPVVSIVSDKSENAEISQGKAMGNLWKRSLFETMQPIRLAFHLPVLLPALYFALVFTWGTAITIVIPETLPLPPWSFSKIAVGGFFFSAVIGAILGKFAGGYASDILVLHLGKVRGKVFEPEQRLWTVFPHLALLPLGLLLFGIGIDKGKPWPMEAFGFGIGSVSTSALAGILQTYICESFPSDAVHGITLFNFAKSMIAFAAPFFVPKWIASSGFTDCYIVQAVLVAGLGLLHTVLLLLFGKRWRAATPTSNRIGYAG